MRITRQHWTLAFSLALVAHAGAAAAVLWQAPPSGAQSAGLGGIELSLGPAGGAPGTTASAAPMPDVADSIQPPDAMSAPSPEKTAPETPEPLATQQPEPKPNELAEPSELAKTVDPPVEAPDVATETTEALAPEPVLQADPVEPEPVTLAEAVAIVEPAPEPEPEPEPDVAQPPQPKQKPVVPASVKLPPAPTAEPTPVRQSKVAKVEAPSEIQVATSVASLQGVGGKAGTQKSLDAGSADQVSGGGLPGQAADYMALLQAWLHKHKEYPRRAQARRQEGTALLYFIMDRDGRVSASHIEKSSGYQLLDEEVLALIQRAQPLPPPPPDFAGDSIKLVVPVQFFLR